MIDMMSGVIEKKRGIERWNEWKWDRWENEVWMNHNHVSYENDLLVWEMRE